MSNLDLFRKHFDELRVKINLYIKVYKDVYKRNPVNDFNSYDEEDGIAIKEFGIFHNIECVTVTYMDSYDHYHSSVEIDIPLYILGTSEDVARRLIIEKHVNWVTNSVETYKNEIEEIKSTITPEQKELISKLEQGVSEKRLSSISLADRELDRKRNIILSKRRDIKGLEIKLSNFKKYNEYKGV